MARLLRQYPNATAHSRLGDPVVIGAGVAFHGPGVRLAAPDYPAQRRRRGTFSELRAPVVVNAAAAPFVASPVSINYWAAVKSKQNTQLQRRAPIYHLYQPAAVGSGIAFHGPGVKLTSPASRQSQVWRETVYKLRPPVVVNAAAAPFVAPPVNINYWASVKQKQNNQLQRRAPFYRLSPPARVGAGIVFQPDQINYWAAVKSKQNTQLQRRAPVYRLYPPVLGIVFRPVDVTLAAPNTLLDRSLRRDAKPRLGPPAVVGAGVVFAPVEVHLAYSRRGRPSNHLFAPAVIGSGIAFSGPGIRLTTPFNPRGMLRRGAMSHLFPPAVVTPAAPFFASPVATHLAYSRRGKPFSRYVYPCVVNAQGELGGTLIQLAPSSRGRAKSVLGEPRVVATFVFIASPVKVELAASRRRWAVSFLRPPLIPPLAPPTAVHLVRIRPAQTHPELRAPAVVRAGVVFQPISGHLTYSVRGKPKSKLSPPAVVGSGVVFRPIDELLTPSAPLADRAERRQPHSRLFPPIIPSLALPVRVVRARIRPVATHSFLRPAVIPPPASPVRVALARIRPVAVHPELRAPTVVGDGIIFAPIRGSLAPSTRGLSKSHLFVPAVIGSGVVYRSIQTHLAASSRGKPKSFLRAAVIPPLAPAIHTQLVRIRPVAVHPHLAAPIIPPVAPPVLEKLVTQFVRIELADRTPHYHLFPPAVVGAGIVYRPVQVELTYSRRGQPKGHLGPPAVVGSGVVFQGLLLHLAPSSRGKAKSKLGAPIIPPLAPPVVERLVTSLVRAELADRRPFSRLSPPAVGAVVFRPVRVQLAYSRRGVPKSHLSAPAVVGAGRVFAPVHVELAYSLRGKPKSILFPPVLPPLAPPVVERLAVRFQTAELADRQPHSHLYPPAVIGAGIVYRPVVVHLAPSPKPQTISRLSAPIIPALAPAPVVVKARIRPAAVHPTLRAPAVVGAGIVYRPVSTHLAYALRGKAKSHLYPPVIPVLAPPVVERLAVQFIRVELADRAPHSHLFPPAVVGTPVVNRPIEVVFAAGRNQTELVRRHARPFYIGPAVIQVAQALGGTLIQYARTPRTETRTFLLPPAVVTAVSVLATPIRVQLVRRPRIKTVSFLRPPLPNVVALPIRIKTVKARPVSTAHSHLFAPAVVRAGVVFQPISGHLTYSVRGKPKSKLSPPAVVGAGIVYRAVKVRYAYSLRGTAKSRLFSPVIPPLAQPVEVKLAYSRRGIPQSHLFAPTVIESIAPPVYPVATTLAPSSRGKAKSRLAPPAVIGSGRVFAPIRGRLAPSHGGKTRSHLSSPAVVFQAFIPKVTKSLAASRRGRPFSFLRPPVVVTPFVNVAYPGVRVTLAYSVRGKPLSGLGAGIEGAGIFFEQIRVTLAPSRRIRVHSHLGAAIIPPLALPPKVTLARTRPLRKTSSFLRAPGVFPVAQATQVVLVRIRPQRTRYLLAAPAVVFTAAFAQPTSITLVPSSRGVTRSLLRPPIITRPTQAQQTIVVRLAPSRRLTARYLLKPPTVVSAATPYLRPVDITLAPSRRVRPFSFLTRLLEKRPAVPVPGDICGFDVTIDFICEIVVVTRVVFGQTTTEMSASGDSSTQDSITETRQTDRFSFGSIMAASRDSGASSTPTRIWGTQRAGGNIFGGDRKGS